MLAKLELVAGDTLEAVAFHGNPPTLQVTLTRKTPEGQERGEPVFVTSHLTRENVVALAHSLHVWLANNPLPKAPKK
jgi:hypothetical protein